jgi:LuxR family maltose regulon positive regulatory protein
MLPQFFLKTKLLPPRLGRRVLPRPRLLERMRSYLDRPSTIVCANAGCGKTTLVTDFVRSSGLESVWYQIDPSDLDLAVFFGYLAYGIRNLRPDFGQVTLGFITETEGLASKTDQLVDVFVNEVSEQVEQKTIVVLDDYHHVDTSEPIAVAVDRLLRYLPDVLHIVITSRSMPNLSVTRLRSKGLVGVLDRQDLLFTQGEVEQLFTETFGQPMSNDLVSKLHESTHGWATGLQLIAQAVEHRRGAGLDRESRPTLAASRGRDATASESALLEVLKQSEEEIINYFAEEVFGYETAETQEVLLRLSLFNHIDPVAAGCVLPPEEAYQLLSSLQRRNLFISHVEGGGVDEYKFHPMFRRFLRRRLKAEVGEAGLRALHRELGDKLMQAGKWQKAGLHYAEAHDTEAMAAIMVERGRELLDAGMFEIIKRGYTEVSNSVERLHPEVARLRAHIARMEGDLALAERLFSKAVDDARAIEDTSCGAWSLHELAAVFLQRGEHARAYTLAREALAKAPASDLVLQAQCQHTIGNCQFLQGVTTGEFGEAIETWRAAVELARRAGNNRLARTISHNIGVPYAFTGDIARAREWFSQLVEPGESRVPFPQQALAYCNLARLDLAAGDFDSCERRLEKAMEIARLFNLTLARAEAHEVLGNLQRERGQFHLAREHYYHAESLFRDSNIQLESRELPDEQVRLLLAEGLLSQARAAAEKLMARRAELGYGVPLARARLLVGQALLETGDRDGKQDPRGLLAEALGQFEACRSNTMAARTRLLLARAEYEKGDPESAARHLAEAIRLAREFGYSHWLKTEAGRHPQLFGLAFSRNIEAEYLTSLGMRGAAEAAGVEGTKTLAAYAQSSSAAMPLHAHAPAPAARQAAEVREIDLVINMLGPVEVLREQGRRLAPDAWTLSRALRILCFIASRHNHRAIKDSIVETFWADTPLEDIDKNFWPTISYIRRALNSGQEVKKNFIRYRENAYYLNPEFNYLLDTEEFERLIARARAERVEGKPEAAAEAARRAIELYRGDFLSDYYDSWVEEPRAYYRNIYFAMLKELADHYHRLQDYKQSILYCQMILKGDAYREDVHRQLMDAYALTGNRAALREQYEGLKALLMEELGVDPLPETVATYRRLTGQEQR